MMDWRTLDKQKPRVGHLVRYFSESLENLGLAQDLEDYIRLESAGLCWAKERYCENQVPPQNFRQNDIVACKCDFQEWLQCFSRPPTGPHQVTPVRVTVTILLLLLLKANTGEITKPIFLAGILLSLAKDFTMAGSDPHFVLLVYLLLIGERVGCQVIFLPIQVMMQYKQISVQYNLAFPGLSFTDMHGEYIAVCWLQVDYQNPT
ncbi:hypothetical protein TURU_061347 [Turdus rufiventris]|nr:hypothetical protein TURU_061347 [Turdus rufiventris]